MVEQLETILERYNYNILADIASWNNLKPDKRKTQVVHALSVLFREPAYINAVITRLAPVQREILNILLRHGGRTTMVNLRQRLLAARLIDPGKATVENPSNRPSFPPSSSKQVEEQPNYRQPNLRRLEDNLAHLLACGLVFAEAYKDSYDRLEQLTFKSAFEYFIPEAIRNHLPAPPPEALWNPTTVAAPYRSEEGSARVFQRDLYLYWSYIAHNPVDLTAKGAIVKRHLVALNDSLLSHETISTGQTESDFPRLVFLRTLLEQAKIITSKGSEIKASEETDFFSLKPTERIQRSLEFYLACRQINEITWGNIKVISSGYNSSLIPAPEPILDARRLLLLYLKPALDWIPIRAVVDRLREYHYEFLFKRPTQPTNPYYYYPAHIYASTTNTFGWQFPEVTDDSDGWEKVEAGFITRVTQGPLHWMGLIDVGFSDQKLAEPDLFRLTSIGSWLVGNTPPPEIPQEGGQVIVQPDFTITALDPISDMVLYNLERFAVRLSAERAVLFRLTQQSVYAAQQAGWDANRIRAYLEELTHIPLPSNINRTLSEWQAHHERITFIRPVSILHAAHPEDLADLKHEPQLAGWLANQPAPGLVILPPKESVTKLFSLLTRRRWLPLMTTPSPHAAAKPTPDAVEIDHDGRLRFSVAAPDLFLRGHLARLAEEDGQEGYRLTPRSIQRAMASGITIQEILQQLRQVLRNSLPPALEKQLVAWSGHYGSAALDEIVVLRFKDEKVLKELLNNPELSQVLKPLRPSDFESSVQVRPRDLDRIRQLMAELGIEIKNQRDS